MTDYTTEVTQLYEAIEYRAPDTADLNSWVAQLNANAITFSDVVTAVENDPYTQNFVDPVIREYQAAFGRVPDQAGINYWVNIVANNPGALAELSTIFANSAEFATRYGLPLSGDTNGTDTNANTPATVALVEAMYENTLGRAADAAGLSYWLGQHLTAAQLLQDFAQSPEFISDTNNAITAFQNEEVTGTEPTSGSLLNLAPTPGAFITLTTAIDSVVVSAVGLVVNGVTVTAAPANNNNTIVATQATFNPLDTINMGGTTGNTFEWQDNTQNNDFLVAIPAGVSISGVQTADFTATDSLDVDTQGWNGLTQLNVTTLTGDSFFQHLLSGDVITVDPGTSVDVTDTIVGNFISGIVVNGGLNVTVTENNQSFFTLDFILVNGDVGTSSVTINQTESGFGHDQVAIIHDQESLTSGGTISSVTLNGLDFDGVFIYSAAVANLSVSDVTHDALVTLFDLHSPFATYASTLNLTLDNVDPLILLDAFGQYSTLNVTTVQSWNSAGMLNPIDLDATMEGVENETVSGDGVLNQNSFFMGDLETITVSGAAGLTDWNLWSNDDLYQVTSTSTGTITVHLNDEHTAFTGGPGTDFVWVQHDATQFLTGGTATNNEIVFNLPGSDLTISGSYNHVTNFEILGVAGHSIGTYNLGEFHTPIANVDVIAPPDPGALIFTGAAVDQTLSIDHSMGGGPNDLNTITLYQGAAAASSYADILNLNLGTATTFGIDTSDALHGLAVGVSTFDVVTLTTNPVGGVTTTDTIDVPAVNPTYWSDSFTVTTPTSGEVVSIELAGTGIGGAGDYTASLTYSSSDPATDAGTEGPNTPEGIAYLINHDPNLDQYVSATATGATVTITSLVAGGTSVFNPTVTFGGADAASLVGSTPWQDTIAFSGATAGNTETVTFTSGSIPGSPAETVTSDGNAADDATALANEINGDSAVNTYVHATTGTGVYANDVIIQALTAGPGFTETVTLTSAQGTGSGPPPAFTSTVLAGNNDGHITYGVSAGAQTDTLTVETSNANYSQLEITDSANGTGNPVGYITVTPNETVGAIALAIQALLEDPQNGGGGAFTNVTVGTGVHDNQVTFTYPSAGASATPVTGLTVTDTNSQVDTLDLTNVNIAPFSLFNVTINGTTIYYANFFDTNNSDAATGIENAINAAETTTGVQATLNGDVITLESYSGLSVTGPDTGTAFASFTDSGLFVAQFDVVGTQAITADGYETVNLASNGLGLGVNLTYLVDNALTTLNITGDEALTITTGTDYYPGALTTINTTGVTPGTAIDLTGILGSEVTTGITATLGAADVLLTGNAGVNPITHAAYVDTITGSGSDLITGTDNGGNTHVTLTGGFLSEVDLSTGTMNVVTFSNDLGGNTVHDSSGGSDVITFGNGAGDYVSATGSGAYTIGMGDGAGDNVSATGSGAYSITLGNGAADYATADGTGAYSITLGNGEYDYVHAKYVAGAGAYYIQEGNGNYDQVDASHSVNTETIVVGNGNGDTVWAGQGGGPGSTATDTITVGTGIGDTVVFGYSHYLGDSYGSDGIADVTYGAHTTWDIADFSNVIAQSFATSTSTGAPSVLTDTLNVITGLVAGDHILLPTSAEADVVVNANASNLAGVAGHIEFANGTYNGTTFAYAPAGHDVLLTYDADGSNTAVSVVLVGDAGIHAHAALVGNVLTLG